MPRPARRRRVLRTVGTLPSRAAVCLYRQRSTRAKSNLPSSFQHPLYYPGGGFVRAFDQVPVGIERDRRLTMTEATRDRENIDPGSDQRPCMTVAQTMEADSGKSLDGDMP